MTELYESEAKMLSVSEYNSLINDMLSDMLCNVLGEVTELNLWQNKYAYMTIKDTNVDSVTTSVFGVALKTPEIFKIKIGDVVKISGYPGIHNKSGRQSLQIEKIEKLEEGFYVKKREELILKLTNEGLIDPLKKRNIFRQKNRVALITAVPSQAFNDFTKIYDSRWGQGTIDIYKSQMQGKDAYKTVISCLDKINNSGIEYDCIVIARGGGSKEDLINFDNEELVRKLFASHFPTVSAIGHEGDISIMDLVADLRASTPSNAAELITTPDKNHFFQYSDSLLGTIFEKVLNKIDETDEVIERSLDNIIYLVGNKITLLETTIDNKLKLLDAFDINNTLKRGFSIITDDKDHPIENHENIHDENIYNIYLKDGKSKKYNLKRTK